MHFVTGVLDSAGAGEKQMCVTPTRVFVNGRLVETACRKCWQCRQNRINDWVGRCIAESQDAGETTTISLTYGSTDRIGEVSNDLGSSVLIYSDVQKWIKRLRAAGYPLRYFLAGEYGEQFERSHWHCIIFWQYSLDENGKRVCRVPNYMQRVRNFSDKFWPHGYTFWDGDFNEKSAYYVCKYIMKTEGAKAELHMSKKPPLGFRYFERLAEQYAQQGVIPKSPEYSFPDVIVKKTGLPRVYYMQGVTLDNFCNAFIAAWEQRYGSHPLDKQHSEFLQNWLDAVAPKETVLTLEQRPLRPAPPIESPDMFGDFRFSEVLNVYYCVGANDKRLFWSFDERGLPGWVDVIRTESEAARLREAFASVTGPADIMIGRRAS